MKFLQVYNGLQIKNLKKIVNKAKKHYEEAQRLSGSEIRKCYEKLKKIGVSEESLPYIIALAREGIVSRLEAEKKKIRILFVPDTLEYLRKGGRIGGAQALLGTLLQIKPVLHFHNGIVDVFDKVRTKKKAVQRILKEIPRDSKRLRLAVLHALALQEAEEIREMVLKEVPHAEVTIDELGPVISIHAGPRVVGLTIWPLD